MQYDVEKNRDRVYLKRLQSPLFLELFYKSRHILSERQFRGPLEAHCLHYESRFHTQIQGHQIVNSLL